MARDAVAETFRDLLGRGLRVLERVVEEARRNELVVVAVALEDPADPDRMDQIRKARPFPQMADTAVRLDGELQSFEDEAIGGHTADTSFPAWTCCPGRSVSSRRRRTSRTSTRRRTATQPSGTTPASSRMRVVSAGCSTKRTGTGRAT